MPLRPEQVWLRSVRGGWALFARQPLPFVLVTLIYGIAASALSGAFTYALGTPGALVVLMLTGPCLGGLSMMLDQARREQDVDLNLGFSPWQRPGDYLVVGLAVAAGALLLLIGVLVTYALFMFAPLLVAEGRGYADALRASRDLVVRHWQLTLPIAGAIVVASVLAALVTFSLGLLVVVPVSVAATRVLLEHLRTLP